MKDAHLISRRGTPPNRICHSNQITRSEVRTDQNEKNCINRRLKSSLQRRGIKIYRPENRPCHRKIDLSQDMSRNSQWSIGKCRFLSHLRIRRNSLNTPLAQKLQPTVEILCGYLERGTHSATLLCKSDRRKVVGRDRGSVHQRQKPRNSATIQTKDSMDLKGATSSSSAHPNEADRDQEGPRSSGISHTEID
jgi:hypothetical protein